MFQQDLAPLGSLTLSALVALLPLATIFVLLGWLRVKAHWAGLASLAVAIVVAVTAFRMPVGLALLSATEGAVEHAVLQHLGERDQVGELAVIEPG